MSGQSSVFRADDQALLEELEDEALVSAVFRAQTNDKASLPRRASGLISAIRALDGGQQAVETAIALSGRVAGPGREAVAGIFPFLLLGDLTRRPPRFVHQLGIYFDRVAKHYEEELERGGPAAKDAREAYLRARVRSMGAFFALFDDKTYFEGLARKIGGASLSSREAESTARSVSLDCFDELKMKACMAARDLTPDGEVALAALALVGLACEIAGLPANRRPRLLAGPSQCAPTPSMRRSRLSSMGSERPG